MSVAVKIEGLALEPPTTKIGTVQESHPQLIVPLLSLALSLAAFSAIAVVWNTFIEKYTNYILGNLRDDGSARGTNYAYAPSHAASYATPEGARIYLIVYTRDNPEGGNIDFRHSAETRAADIEHSGHFDLDHDIVVVAGVKTKGDFESLIRSVSEQFRLGKIQEFTIFSHGGVGGPIFHDSGGKQEQYQDFMADVNFNFSESAAANFLACRSAAFAQGFADAHRIAAFGFLTRTVFSGSTHSKTYNYLVRSREYTLGGTGRVGRVFGEALSQPDQYDPFPWWMH